MDCAMPTLSPFLAWVSCQGTSTTTDDDDTNNNATSTDRRAAYLRRDSSWSVDVLEIDPSSYAARLPPNMVAAAAAEAVKNYDKEVSEIQRFYYKRRSVSQQQQQQQQQAKNKSAYEQQQQQQQQIMTNSNSSPGNT
jgi:transcription initiation factor TFIID subunit TAF12